MELTPLQLASSTNQGRDGLSSATRLVNCYKETTGPDAKGPFELVAVNGYETYATLTGAQSGVRRMLNLDSELLVVAGAQLYCVKPDQSVTLIDGLPQGGLTTMARNRQSPNPQAVIVAGGMAWVYQNGALNMITDTDLIPPVYVTVKDGYFVFLAESGVFQITGIDDVTIDGLDFASAQTSPDKGVALATRGTELLIFGERSTEFWVNTGNADFPFELQNFRNYGCYSAGSVDEITAQVQGRMVDSVCWAATDEQGRSVGIYMLDGYEALKISTYEIDRKIEADASPDDMRGFSWAENGHHFYTITGTDWSFTYDTVEGAWHERRSSLIDYWRVKDAITFDRKTILGDALTGTLYRSSIDLYEAAGDDISMSVQVPITHAFPYELVLNRVAVDCVMGQGANSTDPHKQDPQIVFDWSVDGGATFGSNLYRGIGAQGQKMETVDFWGLGRIPRNGMVLRFSMSPGIKRIMMNCAVAVERLVA